MTRVNKRDRNAILGIWDVTKHVNYDWKLVYYITNNFCYASCTCIKEMNCFHCIVVCENLL